MTSCAWLQSARVRTRAIRGRPTRRLISICGGSSTAKPTSIGTKARSTPLLLADAALPRRADLRLAQGSNPENREIISADKRTEGEILGTDLRSAILAAALIKRVRRIYRPSF